MATARLGCHGPRIIAHDYTRLDVSEIHSFGIVFET